MKTFEVMIGVAALTAILSSDVWAREPIEDIGAETASHEEIDPIPVEFERLTSLCLHGNGNLLACDGGAKQIKVINPAGEQVDAMKLDFAPEAIEVAADGTIYCGGEGKLARLDAAGKVLGAAEIPELSALAEVERRRARPANYRVSGIAISGKVLFVAYGAGGGRGSRSKLLRFDSELTNPRLIAEDLRGCCQRCDVAASDGVFYVAENTAHRVVRFDAKGRVVGKWGEHSRTDLSGFGSCCNPMNLCFGPGGALYTAESGMARVKRYTPGGKFLGLVGYVGTERFREASRLAVSCSNIAIAVAPDGNRIYVMDYAKNRIRVLQKKKTATHSGG